MDVKYTLNGFDFVWDEEKAEANFKKHKITQVATYGKVQ